MAILAGDFDKIAFRLDLDGLDGFDVFGLEARRMFMTGIP